MGKYLLGSSGIILTGWGSGITSLGSGAGVILFGRGSGFIVTGWGCTIIFTGIGILSLLAGTSGYRFIGIDIRSGLVEGLGKFFRDLPFSPSDSIFGITLAGEADCCLNLRGERDLVLDL